jgi:hypothetical protein
MADEHQVYRDRDILIKKAATEVNGPRIFAEGVIGGPQPELFIDDEPVVTLRDKTGMYIASGFAYDPQSSLLDLAKLIVDYQVAVQQGREGAPPEESS